MQDRVQNIASGQACLADPADIGQKLRVVLVGASAGVVEGIQAQAVFGVQRGADFFKGERRFLGETVVCVFSGENGGKKGRERRKVDAPGMEVFDKGGLGGFCELVDKNSDAFGERGERFCGNAIA